MAAAGNRDQSDLDPASNSALRIDLRIRVAGREVWTMLSAASQAIRIVIEPPLEIPVTNTRVASIFALVFMVPITARRKPTSSAWARPAMAQQP